MKRIVLVAAVLAACFFAVSTAQAASLGVKAMLWYPKVTGDIRVKSTLASGTDMDFADDLGLDSELVPAGEAFLSAGRHRLSATFTRLNFTGTATLKHNAVFAGKTIPKGTEMETELDWPMLDLEYSYDIVKFDTILAGLSLSGVGRIKFMDATTSLTIKGKEISSSFKPTVPMLGLAAHLDILAGILAADVKATGMTYSNNTLVDATAEVLVTPLPFVGISAGYRYLITKVDYDDTITDPTFDGFYAMLRIAF